MQDISSFSKTKINQKLPCEFTHPFSDFFFFFFLTNVPGIVLLTGDSRMTKLFGIWKGVQIINQAVTH